MEYTFDTIKYDEKSSISINNSKFIALSFRVETSEDVKERLEWVAFHHPKTSHICYSYLLRNGESKKEDAGEPSGTAGAPIFNKIRSYEVVDVLVVVVRYYGGVKLGKSGLIHAYSFITDEVLKESEIMTAIASPGPGSLPAKSPTHIVLAVPMKCFSGFSVAR